MDPVAVEVSQRQFVYVDHVLWLVLAAFVGIAIAAVYSWKAAGRARRNGELLKGLQDRGN